MIHHRPQGFDYPLFRRRNLIRSTALGGSMVLSLRLPLGEGNTGYTESSKRNTSIRIDGDGEITLTLPYRRTGRSIHVSIAMSIAEQLAVAPHRVQVKYASATTEFASNGIFDTLTVDNLETVRSALRLLGEAAATARVMLIAAAAERWGANARSCHAREGEVIHTVTWRKLRYGELTTDAAYRPIPGDVELMPPRAESRPG